ncbi:MAG: methyltransferase domain-containing protein, partial [Planctomycetes bacterium]|nr:methyltransferase domain-containing protein [Planctomycetota bacterium]
MPASQVVISPSTPADARDEAVWERVWQHQPSVSKDQALLDREANGPRWRLIVDRLESTFGTVRGLKTIELGCGRGDLSVLLARRGADVTLLDQSDSALAQARSRFDRLGLDARFERGNLLGALDPWRGRFDVVLSVGVVEHFRRTDRTRALAAHHKVLRSDGLAVVSVPHARCIPYRWWKLYLELRGWWPYGLEIPYTKRELQARARAAGFEAIETHALSFRQSLADHWCKRLFGRRPTWADERSILDGMMGLVLVMFGWR